MEKSKEPGESEERVLSLYKHLKGQIEKVLNAGIRLWRAIQRKLGLQNLKKCQDNILIVLLNGMDFEVKK